MVGPRTPGPPLHVHHETDEFFYVIDGHLLVQAGQERHDLGPGCFAWLPRQIPHTYANVSASRAHVVRALKFRQRIAAIWADHGLIVGPPIEVAAAPAASRASPGAQGRRPGAREVTMHA